MDATVNGIDVSEYQGIIDWKKVLNGGFRFAGIKATEGIEGWDKYFGQNWNTSIKAGIRRIAYHFLRPTASGRSQAAIFHDYVHDNGGLRDGDSVMLDIEVTDGANTSTVIACAEQFVGHILEHTHAGIYVYTGPDFWINILGNPRSSILARCPLWLASYGRVSGIPANWPNGLTIWQHTDNLQVPGIKGPVDGDTFYGDLVLFDKLALLAGRH